MDLAGSYFANISRCSVHIMSNLYRDIGHVVWCTRYTLRLLYPVMWRHVFWYVLPTFRCNQNWSEGGRFERKSCYVTNRVRGAISQAAAVFRVSIERTSNITCVVRFGVPRTWSPTVEPLLALSHFTICEALIRVNVLRLLAKSPTQTST